MPRAGWFTKILRFAPADCHRTVATRKWRLQLETLEDRTVPTLLGNSLFPADNPWNERITNAPVAGNSAALVAGIGLTVGLHPDFGTTYAGALNGIPYNVVPGTQPPVQVVVDGYPAESDLTPIPIPANAVIEGDPLPSAQNTGDRHLIVYDKDNNVVYETFDTRRPSETADHQWHAGSEAVWDLTRNTFRTAGYTSADAAGLPILPGLVRPDEVLDQGQITHALRFTVARTQNNYVYPASHEAGVAGANLPRMGERFRLKQNFDISGFSAANKVILQALKDYGMIVADNGSNWYLSGTPSSRWSDSDLHNLSQIPGSAFEVVDLTPVVQGLGQATGSTSGGTVVTINGLNFSGGAGQTQVFFGSTPASAVTIVSDSQIVATAPSHVAGTVAVTVRSPYGNSAAVPADVFTYIDPVTSGANQRFVAQLYVDLLQRTGGTAEVAGWTSLLDQGTPRSQVVQSFETSQERLGLLVDGLYTRLLGRPSDPGGRQGFIHWMQAGATLEQITVTMVTSQEYANSNASDAAFVQSLYSKVLGRVAGGSEVAAWVSALAGLGRAGMANAFVGSFEFRADAVQQLYGFTSAPAASPASLLARLLHRAAAPSPAEVNGWASSGLDLLRIEALFAGTDEFFANA
jgi:hypothetical protein